MERPRLLASFARFFQSLSPPDRIGILVHCDPDGLAAGVIIARAVELHIGQKAHAIACSQYGSHELMERKIDFFRFSRCNKLIVADLSFDQDEFFILTAEKFFDAILFMDHHKVYRDLNSEKTVFIKASFVSEMDPSRYPASKLCFDLFSPFADLKSSAWIACIGILGDVCGLQWKEFIDQTISETGFSFQQLEGCKEIIEAIGLMESYRFPDLLRFFLEAPNPQAVLQSPFSAHLAEMRAEMDYWLEKFEEEKAVVPEIELVWFECKPRFPIKAPLVNKISLEMHPNQTVVFVQDLASNGTHISISGRRQDGKIHVNDLLEAAVRGLPDSQAGGHSPAAGARIPRELLPKFKQNLIAELKKKYEK